MNKVPYTLQPRVVTSVEQKIPRIIHQTFKTCEVPNGMFNAVNTWINLNPEYRYEFYDDERMIAFINNFDCKEFSFTNHDLKTAFDSINPGAGKADIFRYCILYAEGGIYVDVDSECIVTLNNIIKESDDTVLLINSWRKYAPHHTFAQWFLAYKKHDKILKKTLELAISSVLHKKPVNIFGEKITPLERYTGPVIYNTILCKALSVNTSKIARLGDISEQQIKIKLNNSDYCANVIHYAKNHYQYPRRHLNCIAKYFTFKYKGYYDDLSKEDNRYWVEQKVFKDECNRENN